MDFPAIENKRILISPLNWGLGHATRLIPVIEKLKDKNEIIITGNQPSLSVLTQQFPEIKSIEIGKQDFRFDNDFFRFSQLLKFIRFLGRTVNEDIQSAKHLVEEHQIDTIISDNRYGFKTIKTENYIITHQLMLKVPKRWQWLEKTVHRKVLSLLKGFHHILIPDLEDENNLSGDLSHKYLLPEKTEFIGPLSRFENHQAEIITPTNNKVLVILSGPEPQRTKFEKKLEKLFFEKQIKSTFLLGNPQRKTETTQNITKLPHADVKQFLELLNTHQFIISRAGYSTIMDFYFLKRNVILVPTPGQTEQEYLADYNQNNPQFTILHEDNLILLQDSVLKST